MDRLNSSFVRHTGISIIETASVHPKPDGTMGLRSRSWSAVRSERPAAATTQERGYRNYLNRSNCSRAATGVAHPVALRAMATMGRKSNSRIRKSMRRWAPFEVKSCYNRLRLWQSLVLNCSEARAWWSNREHKVHFVPATFAHRKKTVCLSSYDARSLRSG